jgi:uncharacterized repeat protein (TIGR02543 family)
VTVVATHAPGYAFVKWTEGGVQVSDTAVYPFTVNGDRTLVANFTPAFAIATSASPGAGGTTSGDGVFNSGSSVTVFAAPGAGYLFVNWIEGGNPVSASASYTFTATANRALVANFLPITYTVATSASPGEGGTTGGDGTFNSGASVTVFANAGAGYSFVNWTENGGQVGSSPSYTFTINGNRTLVANFIRNTYTINTSASPVAGGTTSGGGTVNGGDSVTVQALGNPGYSFVNWTEGGAEVSASASYTFTATTSRTLVANFSQITCTIATSASPVAGGTTSGGGTVNSGASVTVVATANAGYSFVNWTEGTAVVSATASYAFTASAHRTLVANFVLKTPVLQISSATAARIHGKVDVTVVVTNSGGPAQAVVIAVRKDATIDKKATHEHPPVVLGNIAPGGSGTTILTFSGIKAGMHTLQVKLTYEGGTVTQTIPISVPSKQGDGPKEHTLVVHGTAGAKGHLAETGDLH